LAAEPRPRQGFSLTEVVVVLAILVVLLAAVLPVIGPMRRQNRLRLGANAVAGSLRAARSLAIARSAPCYVYAEAAGEPDRMRLYFASSTDSELEEVLPGGVRLVAPLPADGALWFDPDGSCSLSFTFLVRNDRGDEYQVAVGAASGRVKIARTAE
jgi:prepilin-type N-terminal cleavage/methylation domain-containing protein